MEILPPRPIALILLILGLLVLFPKHISAGSREELSTESTVTIEDMIYHISIDYGVSPHLALNIAYAESGFQNVENYMYDGEYGTYSAAGIFQITRTTYREYCGDNFKMRWVPEHNIDCAMQIITKSGIHHWNESKHGKNGWYDNPYIDICLNHTKKHWSL